jgi:hypothetical protein
MLDPKLYGFIEGILRSLARLFPRGDVPKLAALGIVCSTVIFFWVLHTHRVNFSGPETFLEVFGPWVLAIVALVAQCKKR